jgi:hypothetical protein
LKIFYASIAIQTLTLWPENNYLLDRKKTKIILFLQHAGKQFVKYALALHQDGADVPHYTADYTSILVTKIAKELVT